MTENLIKEVNEIKANDPNFPLRNIDSTIVGYSLMGMAEYCAYLYYNNQELHTKVDVNAILDQAWSMYNKLEEGQ